jgi:hypothetical protein
MTINKPAQIDLGEVARLRERMIAILDEIDRLRLPGDIGAHMDMAIQRISALDSSRRQNALPPLASHLGDGL